jgi:acetoin utilization protein AcuB
MLVSMWMTKDVVAVTPETPLIDVARIMTERRIRRLPVVDASGPLLGLVSSQDVLHAFPADINPFSSESGIVHDTTTLQLSAAAIMVRNPLTTHPEAGIENVARMMLDKKIGALPVMRNQRMVGLISESDIFRAFVTICDPGAQGVRVTFDNSSGQDVFPLVASVTHKHRLRVLTFVSLHKHERPMCVLQVTGDASSIEGMLNDIWKSHHQVISVAHLEHKD